MSVRLESKNSLIYTVHFTGIGIGIPKLIQRKLSTKFVHFNIEEGLHNIIVDA